MYDLFVALEWDVSGASLALDSMGATPVTIPRQ